MRKLHAQDLAGSAEEPYLFLAGRSAMGAGNP